METQSETVAQKHSRLLEEHCRMCAGKLQRAKSRLTSFLCVNHKEELKYTFSVCNEYISL